MISLSEILKILIVDNYNLYSSIDMTIFIDVFLDLETENVVDEVGGSFISVKYTEEEMEDNNTSIKHYYDVAPIYGVEKHIFVGVGFSIKFIF